MRPIAEVADQCLGKMLDKSKNRGTLRPYLRNINVRWFEFDLSDVQEMRFEDSERERYTAIKGDVLICEGGYPGRAAIWPHNEPIYLQKAIHRVRFHEPERAKWFLYFLYFCDMNGSLRSHFTGTGIQHFTGEALKRFRLPFPPLSEQTRIVAILDEAFEGIAAAVDNAEKNLANAREIFDIYLDSAFRQKGKRWNEKTLGDVAVFKNGLNFTKSSKGEIIKIVGVKDFQKNFYVPINQLDRAQLDGHLSADYELRAGDILTVRSNGNKQLIGRCILASEIPEKTSHSGFTIRIRVASKEVFPEYLVHFLKSKKSREALIASGDGANISSLNQQALSSLPVFLPPLSEQKAITKRIEAIDDESKRLEVTNLPT
jgi:type I restriction enzyme S subunit